MTKYSKLTTAVTGALMATTIALFAVGGSPAQAAAHSQSPRTTASDTTTVTWHSPKLPSLWSIYLPKMSCPADYPYMLDQRYNGGSGFRIEPGVEITDYQQGLDVVALDALGTPYEKNGHKGYLMAGLGGSRDVVLNSATNWGPESGFTVVLHCTSDPAQGIFVT